ncbi:unnamed protein product [Adineta ricciae]|uniref:AIG1-type G domain-containing protein n=1 Tax=Adineta ricciae TaxID=249248 RepID=A0A815I5H4_ADIRI|nr:unnamed protein product [Adineta ricciae]
MESSCVPNKKPEYGLIILGNTEVDKSYIGNLIVGYEIFKPCARGEGIKSGVDYHRIDTGSSDLLVYNMPGLIETNQKQIERNKREIMKVFEQYPLSIVVFVWTQVDGRPQPDDIIMFRALQEAYKFPCTSLIFLLNDVPNKRSPTYEGRFLALLTKLLNPMPISLENMIFLDAFNSGDNDTFDATRNRLLYFIAEHRESCQKLQVELIVRSNELCLLREAIRRQYLEIENNKQTFELQVMLMTEAYAVFRKNQEKRYQDMMVYLELVKEQVATEEEKKAGLKGQCQQFWKKLEDEKGICKKVGKGYKIVKHELCDKYKCSKNDNEIDCAIPCKPCGDNSGLSVLIGSGLSAASLGVAGAVLGGAVGVVLGPCAIATAAAGAAAGAGLGGISGAIITLYINRKKGRSKVRKNC